MKKILALLLVLSIMFSFAACGKKEAAQSGAQQELSFDKPAANVNPAFLNWGSRREVDNSADLWYPDGKIGEEYMYFAYGESSSGIVCSYVKDGALVYQTACAQTNDMHLVSEDGAADVDLIFPSEFHIYDLKAGRWYIRANPDFMKSMFVGKSFTEKNDSGNTLSFSEDGTAVEVYQDVEYSGTWKIVNSTTVRFTISEEEYYDFDLVLNGDNTLNYLDEYSNREFYAN